MSKDKTVRTKQGVLEIWEHEAGIPSASNEQKYASRIFNKVKGCNVIKVHFSLRELDAYIDYLNLTVES